MLVQKDWREVREKTALIPAEEPSRQREHAKPLRLDSALHVGRTEGKPAWQDQSELGGEREELRTGRGPLGRAGPMGCREGLGFLSK